MSRLLILKNVAKRYQVQNQKKIPKLQFTEFILLYSAILTTLSFKYPHIIGKKYRLYEVNNRYVLDLHNILDYTYIHYRSNKQNKQEFKQTYYHNNNKNKQNNTKCPN